jgi:RNA polymerase sigma-70 factor (ECF subfamily)
MHIVCTQKITGGKQMLALTACTVEEGSQTAIDDSFFLEDSAQEQPQHTIENIENVENEPGRQNDQGMLVTRVLRGDQAAFTDIVDQYSSLMLRTATMIVGDHDIAEDVVQDAFIQAWSHLADLREASALRPWLMRIVVNQCISFKRRLARSAAFMRQALSDQETDFLASLADDHKGRLERDWDLAHAIENLPPKQRVVIVLHYYNGMTLPEMARSLHTSENTLKKRIQAALTNLRRVLHINNLDEEESHSPQFAPSL